MTAPARYIMLGGFLGAGKTTTLIHIAEYLQQQNKRVGIITNDQAAGLVDTAVVRANNVPVQEIAGGCFCCRFPSLKDAADKLEEDARPDVFLGEPVGSCTDLVATVSYPLRRLYGDRFAIAPLSVVLDAKRALRIFGLKPGKSFSEKVTYIYLKQIEESHALLINKIDLISDEELASIKAHLSEHYPGKVLFACSAKEKRGLDEWMEWVWTHEIGDGKQLPIDYQTYAEGEAALAWCNASILLTSNNEFDGNQWLHDYMQALSTALAEQGAEIAHLKMTLSPEDGSGEIASCNIVDNESVPVLGQQLMDPLEHGALMVNVRAECEPDLLRRLIPEVATSVAGTASISCNLDDIECFKPAPPVPVHRMQHMHEDIS